MTDPKKINRLLLMLDHAARTLKMDAPDLRIVEKLLADALTLAVELNEPPDPYADKTLRPGLRAGDGPALVVTPHPQQEGSDV